MSLRSSARYLEVICSHDRWAKWSEVIIQARPLGEHHRTQGMSTPPTRLAAAVCCVPINDNLMPRSSDYHLLGLKEQHDFLDRIISKSNEDIRHFI